MRKPLQLAILPILVLSFSCTKPSTDRNEPLTVNDDVSYFQPSYKIDDLLYSSAYENGTSLGTVNYISEASGMDISDLNSGSVWSHNDAGNGTEIFLMSSNNGEEMATFSLDNILNIDWEDMAVYNDGNKSSIYLADFGDNFRLRLSYKIYVFDEPVLGHSGSSNISLINELRFKYPDGPQNAEALLVDPLTGDLIIANKEHNRSVIYRLQSDLLDGLSSVTLEKIGELPIGNITAGDISEGGLKIALRNYQDLFLWERDSSQTISEAFDNVPVRLPYSGNEAQGEAFCWSEDGYYTLSEAVADIEPKLYFYAKK